MSACRDCEEKFGWEKPTLVVWVGKEIFSFCSVNCREKWFYRSVIGEEPEQKSHNPLSVLEYSNM